jgi:hypothetical protein
MVKLREKAHASLQAFKEGKSSPLTRGVVLSDGYVSMEEEDELSMLGGKTRLVGKGSALARPITPQILQESPTSHNPVVPFPLNRVWTKAYTQAYWTTYVHSIRRRLQLEHHSHRMPFRRPTVPTACCSLPHPYQIHSSILLLHIQVHPYRYNHLLHKHPRSLD